MRSAKLLAEILFRARCLAVASKIDDDVSDEAAKKVKQHKVYVGNQILKCRQRLHLTQEELAAKTGLTQSHIARLEAGLHAPTYITIEKLAFALGVRMSELDVSFDD